MASFRNMLGLPVKLWDNRAAGQVLQLSSDKKHWEFGTGGGDGYWRAAVIAFTDTHQNSRINT